MLSAIIIVGYLTPGYSHIRQHVSELAMSGTYTGILMNWLGIISFGVSIMLFTIGGILSYKGHKLALLSMITLFMAGACMVIVGLYPCDETCWMEEMSRQATLHTKGAGGTFIFVWISQIIMGLKTFGRHRSGFTVFCLIMAVLGFCINKAGANVTFGVEYKGLVQRIYFSYVWIWLIVSGIVAKRQLKTIFGNTG